MNQTSDTTPSPSSVGGEFTPANTSFAPRRCSYGAMQLAAPRLPSCTKRSPGVNHVDTSDFDVVDTMRPELIYPIAVTIGLTPLRGSEK